MQNLPFFTTRKRTEAERLLPIVAKGNGGVRAFSIKQMEGSHPSFAICYNGNLAVAAGKLNGFASFLNGYLACEARDRATQRYLSRLRRTGRRG